MRRLLISLAVALVPLACAEDAEVASPDAATDVSAADTPQPLDDATVSDDVGSDGDSSSADVAGVDTAAPDVEVGVDAPPADVDVPPADTTQGPGDVSGDVGQDVSEPPALAACLDSPLVLDRPPSGVLPCDLLPPDFSAP